MYVSTDNYLINYTGNCVTSLYSVINTGVSVIPKSLLRSPCRVDVSKKPRGITGSRHNYIGDSRWCRGEEQGEWL